MVARMDAELGNPCPTVRANDASYENLYANCPWCGRENIFNRVTDLKTRDPIAGRNVVCEHNDCGRTFRLTGDFANPPYEMMVFDCYELIRRKRYMYVVLNVAQAYEIFFNLFFQAELAFNPFQRSGDA